MSSLAQQALDLATAVTNRRSNGIVNDTQDTADLAAALQLLAENALGGTPTTDTPDAGATTTDVSINTPVSTSSDG
jgi:hypothetical protein